MNLSIIDGNWVNVESLILGFFFIPFRLCFSKLHQVKRRVKWISRATGKVFADGVALFPLMLLPLASISSMVLESLLQSSKITMAISGVFGVLAILEE
jgi:hypothetical protein